MAENRDAAFWIILAIRSAGSFARGSRSVVRCGEWLSSSAVPVVLGFGVLPLPLRVGLVFLSQRENLHHGADVAGAGARIRIATLRWSFSV